nr:hypothetical protein CspTHAL103_155 [Cyanidium sp. THAL103]
MVNLQVVGQLITLALVILIGPTIIILLSKKNDSLL